MLPGQPSAITNSQPAISSEIHDSIPEGRTERLSSSRPAVLPEDRLEEDRHSVPVSMDLDEAAVRKWQARAEILHQTAALFNLKRTNDTTSVEIIGLLSPCSTKVRLSITLALP